MTTPTGAKTPLLLSDVDERPWYDLIDDEAEPPEDGMQQEETTAYVNSVLWARYQDDPTALMGGPTAIIVYDDATPGSVISPDFWIVFGLDAKRVRRENRIYRIDQWGAPPALVMEIASASTAHRDLGVKRDIYARIGVREYWRLDKDGEYYGEPLVGEGLVDGEYRRFALHTEPNGDRWSRSEVLGLDLYHRVEDGFGAFRFRDNATGEWLNFLSEERAARQVAEARASYAEERASYAEARNRELKAELERLRSQRRRDDSGG